MDYQSWRELLHHYTFSESYYLLRFAIYCHSENVQIKEVSAVNHNTGNALQLNFEVLKYKFNLLVIYRHHQLIKVNFIEELQSVKKISI